MMSAINKRTNRNRRSNQFSNAHWSRRMAALLLALLLLVLFFQWGLIFVHHHDNDPFRREQDMGGAMPYSGVSQQFRGSDKQSSRMEMDNNIAIFSQLLNYSPLDNENNNNDLANTILLQLPTWIQDYVKWHQQMRRQFPGKSLFDDPKAPPLLIRTCLGLCGGLNDRLGQLPFDFYLANQTKRLLLLHWHRPVPLEEFLLPHGLDWTVPRDVPGFFAQNGKIVPRRELQLVRSIPDMFEGFDADRPDELFWNEHFPVALERAKWKQQNPISQESPPRILRHRLLGHLHESVLEERLRALGETDLFHSTRSFGLLFALLFRPSDALHAEWQRLPKELGLFSGSTLTTSIDTAVHCRVRHPKFTTHMVKGKNEQYPADKTGLPWNGLTRRRAIALATHALQCALAEARPVRPASAEKRTIYFFSDSNDLVHHFAHELQQDSSYVEKRREKLLQDSTDQAAWELMKQQERFHVVARNVSIIENAHIDKQKGRPASAYFGTFLDMFLAVQAQCVVVGVGYYAIFSAKLSKTHCTLLYQQEAWDSNVSSNKTERLRIPGCSLPRPAVLDEEETER